MAPQAQFLDKVVAFQLCKTDKNHNASNEMNCGDTPVQFLDGVVDPPVVVNPRGRQNSNQQLTVLQRHPPM